MRTVFFLLFFLTHSTFAITLKKLPSGAKLIDLNSDGKVDFQLYQNKNIIDIYFKNSSGKKQNITSKRDGDNFLKEYKTFDGVNWKLQKKGTP